MASTNSWTLELESRVAAQRKFRACVMDWHNLAPKLAPHIFDSAHHAEGDGGIGSVRHYNCNSGMHTTHKTCIHAACCLAHMFKP
jgi:hypothetical protein